MSMQLRNFYPYQLYSSTGGVTEPTGNVGANILAHTTRFLTRKPEWRSQRTIRRVSTTIRRLLAITPPRIITIKRSIITPGQHEDAKKHATAAQEHSDMAHKHTSTAHGHSHK
jgi:hypothetical protein